MTNSAHLCLKRSVIPKDPSEVQVDCLSATLKHKVCRSNVFIIFHIGYTWHGLKWVWRGLTIALSNVIIQLSQGHIMCLCVCWRARSLARLAWSHAELCKKDLQGSNGKKKTNNSLQIKLSASLNMFFISWLFIVWLSVELLCLHPSKGCTSSTNFIWHAGILLAITIVTEGE